MFIFSNIKSDLKKKSDREQKSSVCLHVRMCIKYNIHYNGLCKIDDEMSDNAISEEVVHK